MDVSISAPQEDSVADERSRIDFSRFASILANHHHPQPMILIADDPEIDSGILFEYDFP